MSKFITTVIFFHMAKNVLYGIKYVRKTQWEHFETFEASLVVLSIALVMLDLDCTQALKYVVAILETRW